MTQTDVFHEHVFEIAANYGKDEIAFFGLK